MAEAASSRAPDQALGMWHGIGLSPRLVEAIARQATGYAKLNAEAAVGLRFDDEPAHFARVRDRAPPPARRP